MPSEFELAIDQICEEKGLKKEEVIETIGQALAAAYKKDYAARGQNVKAEFDPKTGACRVFDLKDVVENEEKMEKPKRQIILTEAKKIKKDAKAGDVITTEVTPKEIHFGRIAAQTAKQVLAQRIREAEKNMIYDTFKKKEGQVLNVTVQRLERNVIFVDLGTTSGILLPQDQIFRERYRLGQRLKVYLREAKLSARGAEIYVSRTSQEIVKKLFEQEVPEISNGSVEIKAVAREAGSRSKIAVLAKKEEVDPIGACIGQRGVRVQTVIAELGGEKIDVIEWSDDPVKFITHALSPAKILSVKIKKKEKKAEVAVREDQLSLAIGREGQNVRLAVKLTGWNIDIIKGGKTGAPAKAGEKKEKEKPEEKGKTKAKETKEGKVKTEEKKKEIKAEPEVKEEKKKREKDLKKETKEKKETTKPEIKKKTREARKEKKAAKKEEVKLEIKKETTVKSKT
jgi:N utilization substance protein A